MTGTLVPQGPGETVLELALYGVPGGDPRETMAAFNDAKDEDIFMIEGFSVPWPEIASVRAPLPSLGKRPSPIFTITH